MLVVVISQLGCSSFWAVSCLSVTLSNAADSLRVAAPSFSSCWVIRCEDPCLKTLPSSVISPAVPPGSRVHRCWACVSPLLCLLHTLSGHQSPSAEPPGKPRILEWVAYPFSRGSSWPRNQTGVSCIAGGFFTSWATREALLICIEDNEIHPKAVLRMRPNVYKASSQRGCPGRTMIIKTFILIQFESFC